MGGESLSAVVRLPSAERDLNEIWRYIAHDEPSAADRQLDRLRQKLEILSHSPRIGTPHHDMGWGLRSFAVGRYVLWYREIAGGIELVRVLHGSRRTGPGSFD